MTAVANANADVDTTLCENYVYPQDDFGLIMERIHEEKKALRRKKSFTLKMWKGAVIVGSTVTATLDYVDGRVSSILGLDNFDSDEEYEEKEKNSLGRTDGKFGVGVFVNDGGVSTEQIDLTENMKNCSFRIPTKEGETETVLRTGDDVLKSSKSSKFLRSDSGFTSGTTTGSNTRRGSLLESIESLLTSQKKK